MGAARLSKTRAKTVAAALALASSCLALPQPEALAGPIIGYRVEVGPKGAPPIALYAEESGSGTPVVLLHGLGESTFTWRKIIPALAASHRVVALDLKGFGRSEKPLDQAYSADDQAALVAAFLDKRGLTGVTLVGHSFGGTVALRTALALAAHDPSRIARLVVISAPAFPHAVAPYLDLVETPAVPEALVAPMPPEALARILLSESRGGGEVPDEDVKGYAAPYYDLAAKHAFLVTARSIVTDADNTIRARYRTLRQPSLVIWCRNDPIVPLAAGRRLTRALPNARLAVLKGCHHLPQDERPDALLAQLKPFLAR